MRCNLMKDLTMIVCLLGEYLFSSLSVDFCDQARQAGERWQDQRTILLQV